MSTLALVLVIFAVVQLADEESSGHRSATILAGAALGLVLWKVLFA